MIDPLRPDSEYRRPLFDSLAWIMMIFLFLLLAMVWTTLDKMEEQNREYWASANKYRQELQDENTEQSKSILDLHTKVETIGVAIRQINAEMAPCQAAR